MSIPNKSASALALSFVVVMLLSACSVNVKKNDNGEDKNVDINTPVGGIHVSNGPDVRDTGLPVYPGARLKLKDTDGDQKNANVDISGFGFGVKVVAVEYASDDPPAKLIAYYENQLKKYGNVLQCRSNEHVNYTRSSDENDSKLKCEGDNTGENVELKVGTEDNQHIVAVQPDGSGASFTLVYVRTHGKDTSI